MDQLQVTATFPNITPADLDQFKQLAGAALELTKAEVGALQYDWFFSADETKCLVRETYENSDAALAHMANLGELLGQLAQLGGGLEVEVFGAPSGELMEAAAAIQPTIYSPFQRK
jgi:quinol monooxygenase YgiN